MMADNSEVRRISQAAHDCMKAVEREEITLTEDLRLRFSQGVKVTQIATQKQAIRSLSKEVEKTIYKTDPLTGKVREIVIYKWDTSDRITENTSSIWVYGNNAIGYLSSYFRNQMSELAKSGAEVVDTSGYNDPMQYGTDYLLELIYREQIEISKLDPDDPNKSPRGISRKVTVPHEQEKRNAGRIESFGFKASSGNRLPVFSSEISSVNILPSIGKLDPGKVEDPRLSKQDRDLLRHVRRFNEKRRTLLQRSPEYTIKSKVSKLASLLHTPKVKKKSKWGTSDGTPRVLSQNSIDSARYKEGRFELSNQGNLVWYLPDKGYATIAGIVISKGNAYTLTPGKNGDTDLYLAALKYIGGSITPMNRIRATTLESTKFGESGIHKQTVMYIPSSKRLVSIQSRLRPYVPFDDSHLLPIVKDITSRYQSFKKNRHVAELKQAVYLDPTVGNKQALHKAESSSPSSRSKTKRTNRYTEKYRDVNLGIQLTIHPDQSIEILESSGKHYFLKSYTAYDTALDLIQNKLIESFDEATARLESAIDTAISTDKAVKIRLID